MDSEIAFASNIVLPCAASKPNHPVRKAEFDDLVARLDSAIAGLPGTEKKTVTAILTQFSQGGTKTITHNIGSFNYLVDLFIKNNATSYTNSYLDSDDMRKYVDSCFEVIKYQNTVNLTCHSSGFWSCNLYVIIREV